MKSTLTGLLWVIYGGSTFAAIYALLTLGLSNPNSTILMVAFILWVLLIAATILIFQLVNRAKR